MTAECRHIDGQFLVNNQHASTLWDLGFYGNRPNETIKTLAFWEVHYLLHKGFLQVQDSDATLTSNDVFNLTREKMQKLRLDGAIWTECILTAYTRLRDAGWIVRSGLNYGTDFVLYRHSPETQHAEYAVRVVDAGARQDLDWRGLLGINRSCAGAKKVLINR